MTTNIYDLHTKAFSSVSAHVILKDGVRVATVAFRFPKDGAGRLWAYVHWIGVEMVRGYANGYGYDKKSAAVENAAVLLRRLCEKSYSQELDNFSSSISNIGGATWESSLKEAGYTVFQAV